MRISYFDFLDRDSETVVFGCRAAVEAFTKRPVMALLNDFPELLPADLANLLTSLSGDVSPKQVKHMPHKESPACGR
nr:MAG TPA: hypothetical protein [Caudoviricetes sp.]